MIRKTIDDLYEKHFLMIILLSLFAWQKDILLFFSKIDNDR